MLRITDGQVAVMITSVLIPVLKIAVLDTAVPAAPVRITLVLKPEPEARMDGVAKPFAVEFV